MLVHVLYLVCVSWVVAEGWVWFCVLVVYDSLILVFRVGLDVPTGLGSCLY